MSFNPRFPPKHRESEELGPIDQRIEHADGVEYVDPNRMIYILAAQQEWLLSLKPLEGQKSVISGEPAVVYRAADVAIPLTTHELYRLASRDLRPDEFFKLREVYGDFFEIHEDFYDHGTGEPLQALADRVNDPSLRLD